MDPLNLVPRDKHDIERVNALVAAGPLAAIPVLDELLSCLQDINWPIAPPIADLLVLVGDPLIPHLKKVLRSGDDMWIYWVLNYVVARIPDSMVKELRPELDLLTNIAENDMLAIRIGVEAQIWPKEFLDKMIVLKMAVYQEFINELKGLQG